MPNWKKLITSGSDAELNSLYAPSITGSLQGTASFASTASYILPLNQDVLINGSLNVTASFTASGLNYPDTDGVDRQVIKTDGLGNLTFGYPEEIIAVVKNVSGGTLLKGTPVHATESGAMGNVVGIVAASASDASTMPATFVLNETLADEAEGEALASGFIQGVNTSGFEVGQVVYVGESGGYTNVKPTGSNLIQNLGIVTKIDATNGSGYVLGAGRANDVPNILEGYTWIGNSDGVAIPTPTSSIQNVVSSSYALTASYVAGASSFPFTGSALITGSLGVTGSISITQNITASNILISSSGQNQLIIQGSGSSNPLFKIKGSQGELFSVTDLLSGSLFSVNDISGLPILEVFSDSTTVWGDFTAPSMNTTFIKETSAGNNILYTNIPTSSYDGVFIDYVAKSASNSRAGNIMGNWEGSTLNFTETTTTSIGNTSGVNFHLFITGSNIAVSASTSTADWTIKGIIRTI